MTNLPKALRARIGDELPLALVVDTMQLADDDTTAKWLWRARDGAQIETVLMRYSARATVCVSSQAGCAMGCTFCATGQAGFERQLSTGEIVEQVVRAQHASPQRVSNVVFMGMGEPLANVDAVLDVVYAGSTTTSASPPATSPCRPSGWCQASNDSRSSSSR